MEYLYEKDIVLVDNIELNSLEKLVEYKKEELEKFYSKSFFENLFEYKEDARVLSFLRECKDIEIFEFEDISISSALYQLSKSRNKGIRLKIKNISLKLRQVELCEYFGLNPYRIKAKFILVFCDNANRLIDSIYNTKMRHIAYLTKDKQKLIIDKRPIQFLSKYDEKIDRLLKEG